MAMDLTMMAAAQRDRELIADFAAEGAVLGKTQVMGFARDAPTDEARLPGHAPDMLTIADAAGFWEGKNGLIDWL